MCNRVCQGASIRAYFTWFKVANSTGYSECQHFHEKPAVLFNTQTADVILTIASNIGKLESSKIAASVKPPLGQMQCRLNTPCKLRHKNGLVSHLLSNLFCHFSLLHFSSSNLMIFSIFSVYIHAILEIYWYIFWHIMCIWLVKSTIIYILRYYKLYIMCGKDL